jgi:endoglucanase
MSRPANVKSLVIVALLSLAATLPASAKDKGGAEVALRRSATLNRGVNLSGWYGGWGDYSAEHVNTWTTPADLAFIHSIGLQYVRLCIDPAPLTAGGYDSPAAVAALARLDQSIDAILASGLSLSITVFPRSDYKKALLTPDGEANFVSLWKFLATHYAARDPERIFYDILNEPEIDDPAKWNAIQARAAEAIRSVDTTHTLIATGARYDGIDELLQVTPLKDENVVYTFHFYEPFQFTHQGATWSTPALAHLKNVPFPADPAKLGPMIASATDPDERNMLADYSNAGWDESMIAHRMKLARKWADAHHVTIICNEFGAFRDTIADAQRAAYLQVDRTSLEALHIPWAEWDYRGNFGIVTKQPDGTIVPDVAVIEALGLTIPASEMPAVAAPPAAMPATETPAGVTTPPAAATPPAVATPPKS